MVSISSCAQWNLGEIVKLNGYLPNRKNKSDCITSLEVHITKLQRENAYCCTIRSFLRLLLSVSLKYCIST